MAKLSKEEIMSKYSEKFTEEDLGIEFLEDIADSLNVDDNSLLMNELETLKATIEEKENQIASLKQKYKDRFLGAIETEVEEIEPVEDMTEEEIIDIRSI